MGMGATLDKSKGATLVGMTDTNLGWHAFKSNLDTETNIITCFLRALSLAYLCLPITLEVNYNYNSWFKGEDSQRWLSNLSMIYCWEL